VLIVSDRALVVMANALETGQLPEEQVLRLAMGEDGEFGLVLDEARDGDEIISRNEKPVLYIDLKTATSLNGAKLDLAEGSSPVRLSLRLPEPDL
jgi:Fe-S cluster assembly iron-binding protein IscA